MFGAILKALVYGVSQMRVILGMRIMRDSTCHRALLFVLSFGKGGSAILMLSGMMSGIRWTENFLMPTDFLWQ